MTARPLRGARRIAAWLVLALLAPAGCAVGDAPDGADPEPGPREELARPAESLAPPSTSTPPGAGGEGSGAGGSDASSGAGSGSGSGGSPGSGAAPGSTTVPPSPSPGSSSPAARPLATFSDPADVSGGPGSVDVVRVELADAGDALVATVVMAGKLPAKTAAGETLGIGVDLYKGATRESDFQLFAEGAPEGWFAYLQGPKGFVRYRGGFAVGGRTIRFTVPWADLPGVRSGGFAAFADWSKPRDVGPNAAAEDQAPDLGTRPY